MDVVFSDIQQDAPVDTMGKVSVERRYSGKSKMRGLNEPVTITPVEHYGGKVKMSETEPELVIL